MITRPGNLTVRNLFPDDKILHLKTQAELKEGLKICKKNRRNHMICAPHKYAVNRPEKRAEEECAYYLGGNRLHQCDETSYLGMTLTTRSLKTKECQNRAKSAEVHHHSRNHAKNFIDDRKYDL